MNLRQIAGGLLSISGATAIRALRCGFGDALDRGRQSLALIDPFGPSAADISEIPVIGIEQIVPEPTDLLVDGRYATFDGSLPLSELISLLLIAKQFTPAALMEIGTYFGSTTRNLAMNLPAARIHTLDLPPEYSISSSDQNPNQLGSLGSLEKDDFHLIRGRELGKAFVGQPEEARIIQHLGDSATYPMATISDPITFFFIDGSHTYEYARNDTLRCIEIARSQSVLLWHDVNFLHAGVVQWIMEMRAAGVNVQRIGETSLGYLQFSPGEAPIARLISQ